MLLLADGTVVYSASDLTIAATCEFALLRGLDARLGRIPALDLAQDVMLDRLAGLGDRHERQVLARLRRRYGPWDPATGRGVVEIARPARADSRNPAALAAARDTTLDALRGGADVVFQAGFFDGRFSGWADFVVREPHVPDGGAPHGQAPGAHRDGTGAVYSVYDAKLARRAKVTALLQLAAYADQLLASDVPVADHVHLVLGDRTVTDHRLADLLPVYRDRRARLQRILDTHAADVGPVAWGDERYRACLRCEVCRPEIAARRDVLMVAGVRANQRGTLAAAGITTIDDLAAADGEVPGVAPAVLTRVRAQARLQLAAAGATGATGGADDAAGTGGPAGGLPFELFAPDVVGQLPPPDAGDIFFDFEGDPLWVDDAGEWGLEYLFGVVEAPEHPGAEPAFRAFWAHDRAQERQALLDFLDYVARRRAAHPGMHVYHYAAYEKTALLRLAGRFGVGEEEVDQLLRDGVLVDLYQVVRGSLRIGGPSYSLKKLEPLYMAVGRSGDVQTAGESVVEYAQACDVRDAGRLGEWAERLARIADYNAYDCRSTLGLRDWLLARAAEAGVTPTGTPGAGPHTGPDGAEQATDAPADDPKGSRAAAERAADAALAGRLLAHAGGPTSADRTPDQQAVAMLAAAIGYHRREEKPHWWAHFDRLVSHPAEWTDRRNTFQVERALDSGPWRVPPRGRTHQRVLRLVGRLEPGSSLAKGSQVCAVYDPPVPDGVVVPPRATRGLTDKVTVLGLEATGEGAAARDVVVVSERMGTGLAGHHGVPMALTPGRPPDAGPLTAAIRQVADVVAAALERGDALPDQPALDLLRRRPPRTAGGPLPAGDDVAAITAAVADLDGSYLAVQGPPGTGKTYTGARVIAALVARGWRVGVVAQSHAVVENMLREVAVAGVAAERIGKRPNPGGSAGGAGAGGRAGAGAGAGAGGEAGAGPDDGAPWTWIVGDRFGAFHAAQRGGYVVGGTAWDFTNAGRQPDRPFDLIVVDEAGQFALADTVAVSTAARNLLLLGDPQQLPQVTQGRHPEPVDRSALGWLADGHQTLPAHLGYFLHRTWRMHPALCAVVSRLSYEDRLGSVAEAAARSLDGVPPGVGVVEVEHTGNAVASTEEAAEVVAQVRAVVGRTWHDPAAEPPDRPLEAADVVVVAAYNAQVWAVRRALDAAGLPGVRVGTVDRFQGQQAVVVVVTMAASSPEDVPRGMEFLLNRNRVNVAVSRAQWRAVVVRSARLTDYVPFAPDALAELGAFLGLGTADNPAG